MGKITIYGLKNVINDLGELSAEAERIFGKAIYAGADIITDEVRERIKGLNAVPDVEGIKAWRAGKPAPLTIKAKAGLLQGLGIATMQKNGGSYDVKVGFDGYNEVKTKKYPNGQPNVLIARSFESGSSIAAAQPFFAPAVGAKRRPAQNKMEDVFEQEVKKIMK